MRQMSQDDPQESRNPCTSTAPLVSVITPTYNRARLLLRAIRSVLDQDFTDFELLVIDDGSTDDTERVVTAVADPRVRYSRFDTNRGVAPARCEGISRSRGKLVAFLDHDDSWKPGKLTKVVTMFERQPKVDIIFSDFDNINHIQNTRERGFVTVESALQRLHISPLGEAWWAIESGAPEALMRLNFIGTCSVVVMRRTVFERAGNFREDISGPEDLEMWWRAALLGARFAYTTEILVERHKDLRSMSAQKRLFAGRILKALNACEQTALQVGRLDLLRHVDDARKRTWCDLAEACVHEGKLGEAWTAVRSALPEGGHLQAFRHLSVAFALSWLTALPASLSKLKRARTTRP
jgi:glycosyltransferase involved in cell wall biosynthesis